MTATDESCKRQLQVRQLQTTAKEDSYIHTKVADDGYKQQSHITYTDSEVRVEANVTSTLSHT